MGTIVTIRLSWHWWLVAICVALVCPNRSAALGPSGTQEGPSATVSTGARPAVETPGDILLEQIRVGTHREFTRVVLEVAGRTEWSVDRTPNGLRILVPRGRVGDTAKSLTWRGTVRSIEPLQRAGGAEVSIRCASEEITVRTMTLGGPDRLVVDIYPAKQKGETPVGVQLQAPAQSPVARPKPEEARKSDRAALPPRTRPAVPSTPAPPSERWPTETPLPGEEGATTIPTPPRVDATPAPRDTARASTPVEREGIASPITVVLDPGHGGHDTGAIGPSGLMEKEVVLDLGLRLRRLLQDRLGVRVLMTRSEDLFVPLPERAAFANRVKADFFISLHVNGAGQRGAVGFETFFFSREPSDGDARASSQRENLVLESNGSVGKEQESLLKMTLADMAVTRDMKESSDLAVRVLASLDKILKVENRGVKSGPFHVLATAAMPAVLVESAFITNPREERRLQREEYRQRIVEAIFEGISGYKSRYEQRLGQGTISARAGS